MHQRLLALAALVAAGGAGVVYFVNFEDAKAERALVDVGSWEILDRDSCSISTCNTAQCVAAQNILTDAGSQCAPRFVDCDFRIGQRVRNLAADAGVSLSPKKYQRIRLVGLRCPVDGGFAYGVPMTDAGWPVYATSTQTPRCVRAPLDGGTTCRRRFPDGGTRFFGTGNVFPSSEAAGSNCEPCGCSVFFGDRPDSDL